MPSVAPTGGTVAYGVPEVVDHQFPEQFLDSIQTLSGATPEPVTLEEPTHIISQTQASICDQIKQCNDACQRDIVSCQACIAGGIGVSMDDAQKIVDKCFGKIVRQVQNGVQDVYVTTYNVLGPPPSIEEILQNVLGQSVPPVVLPQQPQPAAPADVTIVEPPAPPACSPCHTPIVDSSGNTVCVTDCQQGYSCDAITNSCVPPTAPPPACKPPDPCGVPGAPDCQPVLGPIKPTCPKPTQSCPPGYDWWWNAQNGNWQCTLGGQAPGTVQAGGGSGGDCQSKVNYFLCDPTNAATWPTNDLSSILPIIDAGTNVPFCQNNAGPPSWFDDIKLPVIGSLWGIVQPVACTIIDLIKCNLKGIIGNRSCDTSSWMAMSAFRSVLSFLQRWTGLEIGGMQQSLEQTHNYMCPGSIPAPGELDAMYLRNKITANTHSLAKRAHNICEDWTAIHQDTIRTRLQLSDAWRLYVRKEWGDDQLSNYLRENGWTATDDIDNIKKSLAVLLSPMDYVRLRQRRIIDSGELDQWLDKLGITDTTQRQYLVQLSFQYPGPDELIQYMGKGVTDDALASKLSLDDGFADNYSDTVDQFAEASGTSRDVMALKWRGHWSMPGADVLAEAARRLKADSTDPDAAALAIDSETMDQLYRASGVLPYWRDRLEFLSRRPMMQRDLRQAFVFGVVDADKASKLLVESGYTQFAADTVVAWWKAKQQQDEFANAGTMTAKKVLDLFKQRIISEDECREYLQRNVANTSFIEDYISDSKDERDWKDRQRLVKAIEKRYRVGDFEQDELVSMLIDAGLDTEPATDLAGIWETELQLRGKEIAAAVLCRWRYRGVIDQDEQYVRLIRVGYSELDALRIVQTCEADNAEAADKETLRQAKEKDYWDAKAKKANAPPKSPPKAPKTPAG